MNREHRTAQSVVVLLVVVGLACAVVLLTGAHRAAASSAVLGGNTHILAEDIQSLLVEGSVPLDANPEYTGNAIAVALREQIAASISAGFANPFSGSDEILAGHLADVSPQNTPGVFITDDEAVHQIAQEEAGGRLPRLAGALIVSMDPSGGSIAVFWIDTTGERSDIAKGLSW